MPTIPTGSGNALEVTDIEVTEMLEIDAEAPAPAPAGTSEHPAPPKTGHATPASKKS